jgi:hypothetical protein
MRSCEYKACITSASVAPTLLRYTLRSKVAARSAATIRRVTTTSKDVTNERSLTRRSSTADNDICTLVLLLLH